MSNIYELIWNKHYTLTGIIVPDGKNLVVKISGDILVDFGTILTITHGENGQKNYFKVIGRDDKEREIRVLKGDYSLDTVNSKVVSLKQMRQLKDLERNKEITLRLYEALGVNTPNVSKVAGRKLSPEEMAAERKKHNERITTRIKHKGTY